VISLYFRSTKPSVYAGRFPVLASRPRLPSSTQLLCIGHPGSEDLEAEHSGIKTEYDTLVLTKGTFRGLDKDKDPQDNSDIGALQHSCWTYWGHSGAGLFDRKTGALVGVHSSWDDKTGMRRGVPLEAVVAFVKEVEASKREDFAENWRWYVWREPEPATNYAQGLILE
jgi:hypothetical protein